MIRHKKKPEKTDYVREGLKKLQCVSLPSKRPLTDEIVGQKYNKPLKLVDVPSLKHYKSKIADRVESGIMPHIEPVYVKREGEEILEVGNKIVCAELVNEKKLRPGDPFDISSDIRFRLLGANGDKLLYRINWYDNEGTTSMAYSGDNVDKGPYVLSFSVKGIEVNLKVYKKTDQFSIKGEEVKALEGAFRIAAGKLDAN